MNDKNLCQIGLYKEREFIWSQLGKSKSGVQVASYAARGSNNYNLSVWASMRTPAPSGSLFISPKKICDLGLQVHWYRGDKWRLKSSRKLRSPNHEPWPGELRKGSGVWTEFRSSSALYFAWSAHLSSILHSHLVLSSLPGRTKSKDSSHASTWL